MPSGNNNTCPVSSSLNTPSINNATSTSPIIQALQTRLNELFWHLLHLSKLETHKATHDLFQYLKRLAPMLDLNLEQHQTLINLISAVTGERTCNGAKAFELPRKIKSCKEQIAHFGKKDGFQAEGAEMKSGIGGWEITNRERLMEEPEIVAETDTDVVETKWLRLL